MVTSWTIQGSNQIASVPYQLPAALRVCIKLHLSCISAYHDHLFWFRRDDCLQLEDKVTGNQRRGEMTVKSENVQVNSMGKK